MKRHFAAAALALIAAAAGSLGVARADALVNQVVLVQDAAAANTPLPLDSNKQCGVTFTVTQAQAGSYTITVNDLLLPAPLSALNVSVSSSTASVAKLSAAGTSQSQTVTLAAGTYTVQPLATGGSQNGFPQGGSFSVVVAPQGGGQSLFTDAWAVSAASAQVTAGQSILSDKFTVSDGGTYTLSLTDRNLPAGLSSLDLIILNDSDGTPVSSTPSMPIEVSAPVGASAQVSLSAGATYDVFVVAQANSPALAGLYSLAIVSGSTVAYSVTEPVGQLPAANAIPLAAPDTVSLQLNDLRFPAALTSIQAVVTEGATLLAQIPTSTGASPAQFPVTAGTVQVYVIALPGASGQGAYGVYASGTAAGMLADLAEPVLDGSHYGYAYSPAAPIAAGSYQLGVNDYQLPVALGSLATAAVQRGAVLQGSTLQSTSGSATFTAQAGPVTILAFPVLASASADSLFGIVLSSASSGAIAFNATKGIGALFSSNSITISSPGNYVVQANDLAFPAPLSEFTVIVTSGQTVMGEVDGVGTIPFMVNAPGNYVINVLAQVGSGVDYGLYGVEMAPAATLTLSASPATVTSGQTATLTWTSSSTTSCTAMGGWTTSQATSGTQVTPALGATTSYSMTCTGAGGTATATAQVAVTAAAASKGGGGALSHETLLILAVALAWSLRRRRGALARGLPRE